MNDGIVWDEIFSISRKGGVVKFTNSSDKTMWVSIKPVKPKRKINDILFISPYSFVIHDSAEKDLDLTKIYISFSK